jgi:hypothetical protein
VEKWMNETIIVFIRKDDTDITKVVFEIVLIHKLPRLLIFLIIKPYRPALRMHNGLYLPILIFDAQDIIFCVIFTRDTAGSFLLVLGAAVYEAGFLFYNNAFTE